MNGLALSMQQRWLALAPNVRGAVWIVIAAAFFSTMGALVKAVGQDLHSLQIAFFRCLFGLAWLAPFLWRGPAPLRTRRLHMHILRALFGLAAMACMFYGIAHLPLADAIALTFSKPLFMIVLAVLFLGERLRWRRATATAVGFLGVLVMLRPGSGGVDPAGLVALGGAVFVALAMVSIKKMADTERPLTMMLWFAIISTAVSFPAALSVWRPPAADDLVLLVAVGAVGTLGQTFLVRAYAAGEASAVAPFDYSRLLFSAIIGFIVFSEIPDRWTVIGALIIVASTFYIARRESRLGRTPG